jgi:hypothetical protein
MIATERLIADLSDQLVAVRRLLPPYVRALGLIALATVVVVGLAFVRGLRADIAIRLVDPTYLVAVGSAWLTGVTATLAAFELSLPDRSRRWGWLPLPTLALWVSGVSYGCLAHWVGIPAGAPIMHDSVRCLETLLGTSIPLALVLWRMLSVARPMRPRTTAWLAAVAVAGYADTAHLLIHMIGATSLVLIMNLGVAALIFGVAGWLGTSAVKR